jgi:hypothetical protein
MSEWGQLKHHKNLVNGLQFDYNSSLSSDSIESGLITVESVGVGVEGFRGVSCRIHHLSKVSTCHPAKNSILQERRSSQR